LCAGGLLVGLFGAALLMRWLSTELYGVEPTDPSTYAVVALSLVIVTAAACYLPTRRAMHVDPAIVFRDR
jgi:putative ABC transport system permease protein